MKMCTTCLTLFKDNLFQDNCPINQCNGDLADIDDELADYIVQLNRSLKKGNKIPIRTQFCCAGHVNLKNLWISYPYIGFRIYTEDEGHATKYSSKFIDQVIKEPLTKLNDQIREISNITVMTPYKSYFDILDKECSFSGDIEYRIFINELAIDTNQLQNDLEVIQVLNRIQYSFKEFLLNVIRNIPNFSIEK